MFIILFILIVLIFLMVFFTISTLVVSYIMAKNIVFPNCQTLEGEMKWEKERNLWGDFDSYNKNEYTVEGKDGYVLRVMKIDTCPDSNKFIIISHGFTSNRFGAVKYVDVWKKLGFNCIIYDVRGHGENEKQPCSLGNFESEDLLKLINDTYKRYGKDIYLGLQGESMGSSISLSVLKYNPAVKFVVADCGFINLYDLMHDVYSSRHLGFITKVVNGFVKIIGKYDMMDTNPYGSVENTSVPICFIHGGIDDFILPDNSIKMQKACKEYSKIYIVDSAEHALSVAVAGVDAYAGYIDEFLAGI